MVKSYRIRRPRRRALRRKNRMMSVPKLAKAVRRLQAVNKRRRVFDSLVRTYNANVTSDYMYYEIDKFNALAPMFGAVAADFDSNSVVNYADTLRVNFDLANGILTETSKINFHAFVVTLRDEIGSAFNPLTGGLTLTAGVHYYASGTGLFVLNPKVFKVHAQKRFFLDNHGIALTTATAQTQYGTNIGMDFYLKRKQIVNTTGGDWITAPCPPDPSKNAYILVFNDNSSVDAEYPAMNVLHKKTVQSV